MQNTNGTLEKDWSNIKGSMGRKREMDRKDDSGGPRAQHLALTGITAISWKWIHRRGCWDPLWWQWCYPYRSGMTLGASLFNISVTSAFHKDPGIGSGPMALPTASERVESWGASFFTLWGLLLCILHCSESNRKQVLFPAFDSELLKEGTMALLLNWGFLKWS